MCTQKPPHDYSQQLYDKYRESFEEYITTTVRVNCDGCLCHYTLFLSRAHILKFLLYFWSFNVVISDVQASF